MGGYNVRAYSIYTTCDVMYCMLSDSKALPLDRRQQLFHNGTLLITKVSRKDAGVYACAAHNRQGTVASQEGTLRVIGM